MATIDLGKIKLKWRGTYAGGTAYVPDDVVEYTDGSVTSSYICVTASTGNAPSSGGSAHSSWNYMAKGQATSPTTTQGDIIVRGASADQRLGVGSAGQFVKVNSGANGLEYGSVTQAVKKVFCRQDGDRYSVNTAVVNNSYTSMYNWADMQQTITPESSSSVFQITGALHLHHQSAYEGHVAITFQIAGASEQVIASNSETDYRRTLRGNAAGNGGSDMQTGLPLNLMIAPATASAVTFRIRLSTSSSSYPWYVNRDGNGSTDQDDGGGVLSSWTITELDGSLVTTTNFGLYIGT